jgi:hypothetical protein
MPRGLLSHAHREHRLMMRALGSRGRRSKRRKGVLRGPGFAFIAAGFLLFMIGPALFFLLAPRGTNLAIGAALAIVAMGLMVLGGLLIARDQEEPTAEEPSSTDFDRILEGSRDELMRRAENLLIAERHEEAARIYEHLGMWKEAGDVRRRARQQLVTHVKLDLNDLIEKMKQGGLATNYSCPSCGGAIHITGQTHTSSLAHCKYCGASLRTTDVAELLSRVTGYR